MKKNTLGGVLMAVLALASLVWYGCSKEDNAESEGSTSGSIYGMVTNLTTGEYVSNANVQLRPTGENALTGMDGMFEFLDIEDGDYYLTITKAGYTDLRDSYKIQVRKGKRMRRDVQIEQLPAFLRVIDANSKDITEPIDFGSDASIVSKTFYVFNNGTIKVVNSTIEYSCAWIESVSALPEEITPNQTVPVTVRINRSKLSPGQNLTILTVKTINGSNDITIIASSVSGNPPDVSISQASNVTATSALCEGRISNTHGGNMIDCGFCYSTHSNPTLDDNVVRVGPSTETFSYFLQGLTSNTTYHVKAFATSDLGTGYSSEMTFTTVSGLPVCSSTIISNIDPTTARGESSASCSNGYDIIEKGLCWSATHTPTITDSKVSSGFGEGPIWGTLSSLQPNTRYRVRSYATSQFGTTYGPEATFTSLSGLPSVTTLSAMLSDWEITTGGSVTDNAGTVIIVKGVCYGTRPNPDLSSSFQHTEDSYGDGAWTSSIPRPNSSGYLYIRAYATTRYGTGYGNQVSIYIP